MFNFVDGYVEVGFPHVGEQLEFACLYVVRFRPAHHMWMLRCNAAPHAIKYHEVKSLIFLAFFEVKVALGCCFCNTHSFSFFMNFSYLTVFLWTILLLGSLTSVCH